MTSPETVEAVQAVVDRVSSYQETAPEGTVDRELRAGLAETGVEVSDEQVAALVAAIEADGGPVDAAEVLV